ncbi:flagellar hook-length control protein FliK [Effusibacillus dendaii]|uniref:Flagellar hook-length control protein-like C-terminal domain-containing protein n=1 Tax=Effusibacillus dendaii TaxID=2743772 RepID=A0A7I8D583_9BACL|nr:flagellar hook-length control protein FliK [Effusibacillus dendaii]BCJ85264.1 hypothetical protein skT53_02490 [Effusibacillus dendaii]
MNTMGSMAPQMAVTAVPQTAQTSVAASAGNASRSSVSSAKNSNLFQKLFADQLAQDSATDRAPALNRLKQLLSGLDPQQMADVLAMLGMSASQLQSLLGASLGTAEPIGAGGTTQNAVMSQIGASNAGMLAPFSSNLVVFGQLLAASGQASVGLNGQTATETPLDRSGNLLTILQDKLAKVLEAAGIPVETAVAKMKQAMGQDKSLVETIAQLLQSADSMQPVNTELESVNAVQTAGQTAQSVNSIQTAQGAFLTFVAGGSSKAAAVDSKTNGKQDLPKTGKSQPVGMQQPAQIRPELDSLQSAVSQTQPDAKQAGQDQTNGLGNPDRGTNPNLSAKTADSDLNSLLLFQMATGKPADGASQSVGQTAQRPIQVTIPAEQFKTDFGGMLLKQATLVQQGGMNEMRITLVPEGLGEMQVRIAGENGRISLQISADTQYAKGLLDSGIGMLRQQLESQGIQVVRLEVVSSSANNNTSASPQGMFSGQQNPQQQTGSGTHNPNRGQQGNAPISIEDSAFLTGDWGEKANGQFDMTA